METLESFFENQDSVASLLEEPELEAELIDEEEDLDGEDEEEDGDELDFYSDEEEDE